MIFPSLLLALPALLPLAAAAPVRRDANSINAALAVVSNRLVSLDSKINRFTGGVTPGEAIAAVEIQERGVELQQDLGAAANAVDQSAPLTDGESASVARAVASLAGNLYRVLDSLDRKRGEFNRPILDAKLASSRVKTALQGLKSVTNDLGDALALKFSASIGRAAPLVMSAINWHLDRAVEIYG
ncbi:uncharacterized protein UV8b_04811 [Ustilaginoidea virens]|uniref:Cell wall galactomannoprotein n=1 Tax=Ustilaginoidea virens TaxID=1159556 RepID=A0A063BKN3_USTVR|nr:uncharacterized protein UV8b_04811 [Ustilaginoidea virens]QUC20570.1 hypothetical protein UV8b_04811 [Ustilaginoidea virens]GAO15630.1 hypothetical protein UVI_02050610 [Ustilaginoidea virens]